MLCRAPVYTSKMPPPGRTVGADRSPPSAGTLSDRSSKRVLAIHQSLVNYQVETLREWNAQSNTQQFIEHHINIRYMSLYLCSLRIMHHFTIFSSPSYQIMTVVLLKMLTFSASVKLSFFNSCKTNKRKQQSNQNCNASQSMSFIMSVV